MTTNNVFLSLLNRKMKIRCPLMMIITLFFFTSIINSIRILSHDDDPNLESSNTEVLYDNSDDNLLSTSSQIKPS